MQSMTFSFTAHIRFKRTRYSDAAKRDRSALLPAIPPPSGQDLNMRVRVGFFKARNRHQIDLKKIASLFVVALLLQGRRTPTPVDFSATSTTASEKGSAERERVGRHAWIEKLDFELPISDGLRLSDQLV